MAQYSTRPIDVRQAIDLRAALIDPGGVAATVPGPADLSAEGIHIGAFHDGTLVGVGSAHPQAMPGGYQVAAWRIRGVGVEHGHRGRGVGARIVARCLEHAGSEGGHVAWCLTPTETAGFFERCGFRSSGLRSDGAEDGPVLMHIRVGPLKRDWALPADESDSPAGEPPDA